MGWPRFCTRAVKNWGFLSVWKTTFHSQSVKYKWSSSKVKPNGCGNKKLLNNNVVRVCPSKSKNSMVFWPASTQNSLFVAWSNVRPFGQCSPMLTRSLLPLPSMLATSILWSIPQSHQYISPLLGSRIISLGLSRFWSISVFLIDPSNLLTSILSMPKSVQ